MSPRWRRLSSRWSGITAIRRRAIAAHRAWMIRAYALAVAAGTQAFTQGIGDGLLAKIRDLGVTLVSVTPA